MTIEMREAIGVGVLDDVINDAGFRDAFKNKWLFLISSKPIVDIY